MTLPLADMLPTAGKWFAQPGPEADGILSSRVRLARNLKGMRFPPRAPAEELSAVRLRIENALPHCTALAPATLHGMESLSAMERQFLVERHLASRDLTADGGPRALAFAPHEGLSLMVNEEDHLRLQALGPGLQLDACYAAVNQLDDELEARLEYAFADDFGYLTACPTNVGTGMRASVLIHLPALVLTRGIKKVLAGVQQVGLEVRGFYGEGTDVLGNFFQISNQITLGEKEGQTLLNLERVVRQILDQEADARELLMREARHQICDKVMRALGTLTHAHLLASDEVIALASAVRLGVTLEMEALPDIAVLNELLLYAQPAHLQLAAGEEMNSQERNVRRARTVRAKIAPPGPGSDGEV